MIQFKLFGTTCSPCATQDARLKRLQVPGSNLKDTPSDDSRLMRVGNTMEVRRTIQTNKICTRNKFETVFRA